MNILEMAMAAKMSGGNGGGGGGTGASSWNAVTGKPFDANNIIKPEALPEGYPYKEQSEAVLVDETITVSTDVAQPAWGFDLVAGENYKVVWDGQEYKVTATLVHDMFPALGNLKYMDVGPDSGEPFIIVDGRSMAGVYMVMAEPGDHTVSITGVTEMVHPLDGSYLPELVIQMSTNHYGDFYASVSLSKIEEAVKAGKKVYIRMTYQTDSKYFVICPLRQLYAGHYATFDYDDTSAHETGGIDLFRRIIVIRANGVIEVHSAETPEAKTNVLGSVRKAAAVADVAGDTPTAAEFNALLTKLRDAGILATE